MVKTWYSLTWGLRSHQAQKQGECEDSQVEPPLKHEGFYSPASGSPASFYAKGFRRGLAKATTTLRELRPGQVQPRLLQRRPASTYWELHIKFPALFLLFTCPLFPETSVTKGS